MMKRRTDKHCILVVDDEPAAVSALTELLEDDFRVVDGADAESALRAFEASAPDLVLTDLNMPGTDGLALVEELRTRRPNLPAVLMSAQPPTQIQPDLDRMALCFVPKPVDIAELVRLLQALLETGSAHRTLALRTAGQHP